MKNQKNDSATAIERFGRDKRKRTVNATSERVERRPRQQRDAADVEHRGAERRSYNPNFSADNRPNFEKPRRDYGERTFGERKFADRDSRGNDRAQYGRYDNEEHPRRQSDRRGGERKFGERTERNDRPAYGDKKFGGKKFSGDGKFADKPRGDRKFGGKPAGERSYGDKKYGKPAFRKSEERHDYPRYNPEKQLGEMRLNRFLAQSGICSRREADDFITAGLVSVNGVIVTELGTKVMPSDEVKFNDSRIQGEKKVYLVLNKPKGYVTSLDDPHAGKTVMELVSGACEERIYPVGRLDKNSLGLLLFTNDGDMTKQLTHPSYKKKKIYQVTLDKPLTRADMDRIAEGITLEDGEIYADEISYVKENKQEIGIEIHSGRNRIVRRIFEFLGYTVTKLDRVYYAGLTKKNLKRGAWRFLSREEVERLKSGRYE